MRIYLAATQDLYGKRMTCRVHRMLLSFSGPKVRLLDALEAGQQPPDWCVDSGAHFFLSSYFKHHKLAPIAEAEAHLAAFVAAMRALPTKPSFVVELDLQDLYGQEVIQRWRQEVWVPFEKETGIRVAYVWHPVDGYEGWRSMLDRKETHFVGLTSRQVLLSAQGPRMAMEAYEAGKPVHGFACVNKKLLRQIPFYSVDSTSWGAGSMFGLVSSFDPAAGTVKGRAAGRSLFTRDRKKAAGNLLLSARGRVRVSDMLNSARGEGLGRSYQESVIAYEEMERFYAAFWRCRGIDWDKRLGTA